MIPVHLTDAATGNKIIQPSYLNHSKEPYPFDTLTLTLWFTQFKRCPLTLKEVSQDFYNTPYPVQSHELKLMKLYKSMYGFEFNDYQEFCTHVAIHYNRNKSNLRTSEAAWSAIPTLVLMLAFIYLADKADMIPLFYSTFLSLLLTFLITLRALTWFNPEYFATDENKAAPIGWIHPECKALVVYWQQSRSTLQLPNVDNLDYKARVTLETMRRMVADVYLNIFKGHHLDISSTNIQWPVHKEIWPGLTKALNYLYVLGAPKMKMPEQSYPTKAQNISRGADQASRENHRHLIEEGPSNQEGVEPGLF